MVIVVMNVVRIVAMVTLAIKSVVLLFEKAFDRKGKAIVVFERSVPTRFGPVHTHLQCVDIPKVCIYGMYVVHPRFLIVCLDLVCT